VSDAFGTSREPSGPSSNRINYNRFVTDIDHQTEQTEENADAKDEGQYDPTDVDILTYFSISDPDLVVVAIGPSDQ
jgi:hypothetical protein